MSLRLRQRMRVLAAVLLLGLSLAAPARADAPPHTALVGPPVRQSQRLTDFSGAYAVSMGLNVLYNANTSGQDVLDAIRAIPYLRHLRYAFLPNGGATLPFQLVNIVNDLGPVILGREEDLPHAELREMSPEDLVRSLYDPNTVVLFSYNVERGNPFSQNVLVLVAYDPERGFGFLNSGDDAPASPGLTWKTLDQMEGYLSDPMTWPVDFVVISRR